MLQLLVAANGVFSSLIILTLRMEAIRSYETSDLRRTTRHHISEDDILPSHRRDHLKTYIQSVCFMAIFHHIVSSRIG
jgi:hypothetical protein